MVSTLKRDRISRAGQCTDHAKLKTVIDLLLAEKPLPPKSRDHQLGGNWGGHRDCHIEPDWILICKILDDEIRLERTGTHSDLF